MAKVKFTGDPRNPGEKESIFIGGLEFPPGKAVELADDHPLVAKLAKNSHFDVQGATKAPATTGKVDPAALKVGMQDVFERSVK